jgi:hypothetical protein
LTSLDSIQSHQLQDRALSGARWFYWIAGLSLITSLVALSGSNWGFVLSLGVTQVIDGIAKVSGADGAGKAIALVLDLTIAGVFVVFGVLASKKLLWAFILGMVLFGLDALILVFVQDWIGVVFHAYALYCIFAGFQACRKWLELQAQTGIYSESGVEQQAAATISG